MTAVAPDERVLRVSLDVFAGPLDLLLSLVREQRLDIRTVPLARVAEQYFAYLATMKLLDVELAAEYLVIAATLVFLKSKSLLPPIPGDLLPEGEETAEEVEERLRDRLITYSRFRGVAQELRERAGTHAGHYVRSCGDPESNLTQRYRLAPSRLADAFLSAHRTAKPERRTILRERYSVVKQVVYVVRALRERGTVAFSSLCAGFDRAKVVATFLAVLDLLRLQRVRYEQASVDVPLLLHPPAAEVVAP